MEKVVVVAAIALGTLVLVALILGLPLMLLWNWLMPTLFNLPTITFWQAVGLNLLSGILFNKTNYKSNEN
jgi:membrane protein required for beta-lactamase induction